MALDARNPPGRQQHPARRLQSWHAATPPERLRNPEGPEVPEGSSSRPSSLHGFSLL